MKLTHTWKTLSGMKVTATCELILKETCFADGENIKVDTCKQNFNITVEGKGTVGTYINRNNRQVVGGVVFPATCGKLAISQENLNAIDKMITEIESQPEWVKKMAKDKKGREENEKYEAHMAFMKKQMRY